MKVAKLYILSTIALVAIIGTSCKPSVKTEGEKRRLSVTNEPQKYFLEQIVGDKYTVNNIIASGNNPESIDLTPSQLISLTNSVAYFKIGFLEVENILVEKVKASNPNIKIIECSAHINIIKDEHAEHSHHSSDDHYHNHSDGDPHTWSSPGTAKTIAKNMYNAMLTLDRKNADYYKNNFDTLIAKIDNTNSRIKLYLDQSNSKSFIIYHPALSYFAKEYGLTQLTIEHEGKLPSPSQLKTLIDRANVDSVKVVFIQQEFDTKNAETIAKAIGAKTVTIDLLTYHWHEEMVKIAQAIALVYE